MRALIAIALIALVGAGALGYAWHLLGKVPARDAAAPSTAASRPTSLAELTEVARLEAADVRATQAEAAATRAPLGFEDGGAAPLVRDWAAIYAERTPDERRAALARLSAEILAARQALGRAELDELDGRRGNAPTTPGVARLLALLEERGWVQASLANAAAEGGR